MKKRVLALLVAVCLCVALLPLSVFSASADKVQYGITLDKDGNFRLNGKRLFAYGVNAAAGDIWHDPFDETFEVCLDTLEKYNIPFTRSLITFGTIEDYQLYLRDPDTFWSTSERMLDMALEAEVGVIVHVISTMKFVSMLGETASAIGDVNSKSMEFMRQWTRDMVTRFKDHPAVWGWEIANEMNLEQDLLRNQAYEYIFGPQVGKDSYFHSVSSAEYRVCKQEIAKVIRKVDPYRIISSGDAIQREAAYSLHQASQNMNAATHQWNYDWTPSTLEQWLDMAVYCTPDPVDTISTHYGMTFDDFRYNLKGTSLTNEQLLKHYVKLAKDNKKGFYFGEFGSMGADGTQLDLNKVKDALAKNLNTMQVCGVQLASLWQRNGANATVTDEGPLAYEISEIGKVNDTFRKRGLLDDDAYWKAAKKQYADSKTTTAGKKTTTAGKKTTTAGKKTTTAGNKTTSTTAGKVTVNKTTVANKTTQSAVTTTTSATFGEADTTTTGADGTLDVSTYMLSRSTRLTVVPETDEIALNGDFTLDLLTRSLAFREGYTMAVSDTAGLTVTDSAAAVESGYRVTVSDPAGAVLRTFTVKVAEVTADTTTTTAAATTVPSGDGADTKPAADGGLWWLWILLAAVVVAGGGAGVYFLVIRKKA